MTWTVLSPNSRPRHGQSAIVTDGRSVWVARWLNDMGHNGDFAVIVKQTQTKRGTKTHYRLHEGMTHWMPLPVLPVQNPVNFSEPAKAAS